MVFKLKRLTIRIPRSYRQTHSCKIHFLYSFKHISYTHIYHNYNHIKPTYIRTHFSLISPIAESSLDTAT